MARDRSYSPRKDAKRRQRSRSRSRGRDRDQERKKRRQDRTRSRSRSPRYNRRRVDSPPRNQKRDRKRTRSRSKDDDVVFVCEQRPGEPVNSFVPTSNSTVDLTEKANETGNEDSMMMMKLMGFADFDTTKGKKLEGNDGGTSRVNVKRKYRQYMNRVGGFNRPLDPVH